MSWLRNSSFRSSSSRQQNRPLFGAEVQCDPTACFDSFKEHWQQASKIIQRKQQSPCHDDVLGVVNHLEQMVQLLLYDVSKHDYNNFTSDANSQSESCLEYLLSENMLCKLYDWGTRTGRFKNAVLLEQLKLYEMLISHSRHQLLVHEPFLRPLLKLLMACQGEIYLEDVEKRLVLLLNQLCVLLMQNIDLLDLFFYTSNQDHGTSKFVIFSLLIPFIHREGEIGMQARDALLLCMSLSKKNKNIGVYIAEHSNICVLLASGLSGLYSVLPHTLNDIETEDWHRFTADDVKDIRDLAAFMNSLEFCNAVAQVAHPMIKQQLHEFLYRGFLIPVMGPALLQNSIDEQIAATAYLDLIIRSATEPGLLLSLIKFLLEMNYDNRRILDILISRINGPSKLSLISLALFETLIDLNCEDIMLDLVFQHLQPCMHLMTTQRRMLHDFDPYCQNVDKFLLLTPTCCSNTSNNSQTNDAGRSRKLSISSIDHTKLPGTINWNHYSSQLVESLYGNYHAYLCDARTKITACMVACSTWTNKYDGCDMHKSNLLSDSSKILEDFDTLLSSPQRVNNVKSTENNTTETSNTDENLTLSSLHSLSESSGYESFKCKYDDPTLSDQGQNSPISVPIWQVSLMNDKMTECDVDHNEEVIYDTCSVGLFINTLFDKLENMLNNNVYVNLHLTGLFSRLAIYPHPLLRTYLLNHKLVLQPNIRSLFQVIGSIKQKIDDFMSKQEHAEQELKQARWFLIERETRLFNMRKRAAEAANTFQTVGANTITDPFKRDEPKRRSLTSSLSSMFRRASQISQIESTSILMVNREDEQTEILHNTPSNWYRDKSEIKNYAVCSIILEEWVKELAAISQEHTIAQITSILK